MLSACRPNWSLLFLLLLVGCASPRPRSSPEALGSWVEIDRRALEANVRTVQRALDGKSRLCAVLKADAYGHGIALVMPTLRRFDVDCVAITSNDEAAAVRATGFSGRLIRIRTASVEEIEAALDLRLEELIGNLALAKRLSAFAAEKGIDLPYHLALNAGGMSRNGIELRTPRDERDALELLRLPRLRLVGIMTHFPVENAADVRRVLAEFVKEAGWISARSGRPRAELTWHAANTFATLEVPESRLDLVRVGGALYGDATGHPEFRRVGSSRVDLQACKLEYSIVSPK